MTDEQEAVKLLRRFYIYLRGWASNDTCRDIMRDTERFFFEMHTDEEAEDNSSLRRPASGPDGPGAGRDPGGTA